MRDDLLRKRPMLDRKGVTLIELLVVLVISGIVIGGVYRVFISQTRAYTVQDQVAEIQQDVRGAMEIMVRDIRLAGFQSRSYGSAAIEDFPIIITPGSDHSMTIQYEYIPKDSTVGTTQTIAYALQGTDLIRRVTWGVPETLLSNVAALDFSYGIDANGDKVVDGIVGETGLIPDNAFVRAASVGTAKIFSVRIDLTANPSPANPDVTSAVSPRRLTSVVTPRNMFLKKYRTY